MPLGDILYLSLAIGAFAVFAIVLAYGAWITRQHPQHTKAVSHTGSEEFEPRG